MTNRNVAITIWWRAILLNALFTGAWAVFISGIQVVLVMMALVIGGFIVTMPLLPLVSLILKFYRSIPYTHQVRYAWLRAMLVLIVWIIYSLIHVVGIGEWWPSDHWVYYAPVIGTSLAVLAAVRFTKSDILNLLPASTSFKMSYNLKTLSDV